MSINLCTRVYPHETLITGSYEAVKKYDQKITWWDNADQQVPFNSKLNDKLPMWIF